MEYAEQQSLPCAFRRWSAPKVHCDVPWPQLFSFQKLHIPAGYSLTGTHGLRHLLEIENFSPSSIASTFPACNFALECPPADWPLGGSALCACFLRGVCAFFPKRTARKSSNPSFAQTVHAGGFPPNQRVSSRYDFPRLRLQPYSRNNFSSSSKSAGLCDNVLSTPRSSYSVRWLCLIAQPFVIALSVKFWFCWRDSPFHYRWCHLADEPPGAAPGFLESGSYLSWPDDQIMWLWMCDRSMECVDHSGTIAFSKTLLQILIRPAGLLLPVISPGGKDWYTW